MRCVMVSLRPTAVWKPRCSASKCRKSEVSFRLDPETQLPQTYLNGECVEDAIRSLEVSNHVSPVAALPFVREAMTAQQQAMGRAKGIVMDGRDIGTAVFPNAELKIFVTASAEVRARRRYDGTASQGHGGRLRRDSQERAGARLHRLAPRNEPLASSSRCAGARQLVPHPRTTERLALGALRRGHPRRLTARTGLYPSFAPTGGSCEQTIYIIRTPSSRQSERRELRY